ncbi:MAG TPA: TetR/AcrR family transcriptional regulator, partial [Anaeromyxobacteraceae bacterium]|nr:TetR/AcrR family transcriptional regulator [Anaeromyxobacteraceae bacterium]
RIGAFMRLPSSRPSDHATAGRILDIAERLVQTRGFNGFSYADVSAELHMTKASLHYHFRTKADLGASLVTRYNDTFQAALDGIDADGHDPREKLRRYVQLYSEVVHRNRICLCGMLASDYATLPKGMRDLVNRFFDANETWLSRVLEEGRKTRTLRFSGTATDVARALVASLEGAMLVARAYGDASRFDSVSAQLLAQLEGGGARR